MEMILDALELMNETIKNRKVFGLPSIWTYSEEDVDGLFQSFDNSYVEN